MDIELIKAKVAVGEYLFSRHANTERVADQLTFGQIKEALLNGEILENYPDTGRGESCLIVGFSGGVPIHVVCGWMGEQVVIITVYNPRLPKFIDPWTRSLRDHD